MAGRGVPPKEHRQNPHDKPERGDWTPPPGKGWQHGKVPAPPPGLMPESRKAWTTWMGAWYAAFWGPEDLPALRLLVKLYDQVERGEYQRSGELRLGLDTWGISPKGQQDRRWRKPDQAKSPEKPKASPPSKRYGHLRAVGES